MSKSVHWMIAGLLLVGYGLGYLWFAPQMPPWVAQHFNGSGQPNGFVGANSFWWFSAAMVAVMLLSMHGIAMLIPRISPRWINMPNKDYWFSGPRRAESVDYLQRWLLAYGNFTLAWMGFVLWRVIVANLERAPLDWFGTAMAVFLIYTTVVIIQIVRRFPKPKS